MILARVDGNAIATIKHPSLEGWRFIICQPIDEAGNEIGGPMLALDSMGAGLHQKVVITTDGSSIRERVHDRHSPARHMVTEIIDNLNE